MKGDILTVTLDMLTATNEGIKYCAYMSDNEAKVIDMFSHLQADNPNVELLDIYGVCARISTWEHVPLTGVCIVLGASILL